MLEFNNVSKRVGDDVHLADINLQLRPGAFNILLGPSLSGKTTLLRAAAGLDRGHDGKILFDGADITALPPQKRGAAMVYQEFVNYPTMNVFDNIASPLTAARTPAAEIRRRVHAAAELLGLSPLLSRRPAELSGGQQQRVALARALIKKAKMILLDEPLANLDYKLREDLRAELPKWIIGMESVVVYATSDPAEALALGGFVAALHEGRVAQFGDIADVFRSPDNLPAAAVFSDPPLNVAAALKDGGRIAIKNQDGGEEIAADGGLARLENGEWLLAFRPHHLLMQKPAEAAIRVAGTVQVAEIAGGESFVHVRAAGCDWVAQTPRLDRWEAGDSVELFVRPAHLLVFDSQGRRTAWPQ